MEKGKSEGDPKPPASLRQHVGPGQPGAEPEARTYDGATVSDPEGKGLAATWHSTEYRISDLILDDYEVVRHLGRGGMGSVYLVRSRATGAEYAVKLCQPRVLRSRRGRQGFLRELITWSELPDHPNLVSFRFFRSVGREVLIFSEFVPGGSLADWIREGRLPDLAGMLDVAIQAAWGLGAAHACGVVHQDMKPGNVLVSTERGRPGGVRAQITDFGLARGLWATAEAEGSSPGTEEGEGGGGGAATTLQVTSGGYTQAFCSPEQAEGKRVGRSTDVWSWGLTLLAMLVGEVDWITGRTARARFATFLEDREGERGAQRVPEGVVRVLRRCFETDPGERWSDMSQASEGLMEAYEEVTGLPYPLTAPKVAPRPPAQELRRTTAGAVPWEAPREWLETALRRAGRDPREAEEIVLPPAGSRRAQAMADLAAYQEILRIYEDGEAAPEEGSLTLARILTSMATLHSVLRDMPGAFALLDRAARLLEDRLRVAWSTAAAELLANLLVNRGTEMGNSVGHQGAEPYFDRALQVSEEIMMRGDSRQARVLRARTWKNKAIALAYTGRRKAARILVERAVEAYRELIREQPKMGLELDLANGLGFLGDVLSGFGESEGALACLDESEEILGRYIREQGLHELGHHLALSKVKRAGMYAGKSRVREKLGHLEEAISIWTELVEERGRTELLPFLAHTLTNKGAELGWARRRKEAVATMDQAIELYRHLMVDRNQRGLDGFFAVAVRNRAHALLLAGELKEALKGYDEALPILERLVETEGRQDLEQVLRVSRHDRQEVAGLLDRERGSY